MALKIDNLLMPCGVGLSLGREIEGPLSYLSIWIELGKCFLMSLKNHVEFLGCSA